MKTEKVRREKFTKTCKVCGTVFYPHRNTKGLYCSLKCRYSDKDFQRVKVNTNRGRPLENDHIAKLKKPKSAEHRKNIGKALSIVKIGSWSGSKNPKWRGGVARLREIIRGCFQYRLWRSDVFRRDNFTCIICGDNKGGNLNADHYPKSFASILNEHHIDSMEKALSCERLWDINNGRTLCETCHKNCHK